MTIGGLVPSLAGGVGRYALVGLVGALAELDAYFFGDPVAAARGISQVAPRGGAASAFTSNNMVVVVRSKSATLRERIRRLLTSPEVKGTLEP
jgi:hypothetical protein